MQMMAYMKRLPSEGSTIRKGIRINYWPVIQLTRHPFRPLLLTLSLLLFAHIGFSQQVKVVKLADLEKVMHRKTDTTYVINFWASWCAPCLKELPYFEQVNTRFARNKVKVIFVNLDVVSKLEEKVKPLVKKNNINSPVLLLDEPDQNSWINRIDPDWSGALPFTILLNNNRKKRKAFEQALTKEELESALLAFLK
jgi:thiol-disulfide isomerase/thioredoxin